jgi:hypothetical protein
MQSECALARKKQQLFSYLTEVIEPVRTRAEINSIIAQLVSATCRDIDRQIAQQPATDADAVDTAAYTWMAFLLVNQHLDRMGDITWSKADRKLGGVLVDAATLLQCTSNESIPNEAEEISTRWQQTFFDVSPTTLHRLAQQLTGLIGNIDELIASTQEQIARTRHKNRSHNPSLAAFPSAHNFGNSSCLPN